MNDFDNIWGALDKKRSPYTMKEIEEAARKAGKSGANFLDTLKAGKEKKSHTEMKADREEKSAKTRQADRQNDQNSQSMDLNKIMQDLQELDQHLSSDFGLSKETGSEDPVESAPVIDADSFEGVTEAVAQKVYGQDCFLRKLMIAFKRPYVMEPEGSHARNSFYIYGPEDSGRHLALQEMAAELHGRQILDSDQVYVMDLSIYTAAGKDNVFLQDLYMALRSPARILLFEGMAGCHISYLTYLSDLVIKGECRLQDRYIEQRGQLINVSTSFASDAISTFTPQGKYLVFLSAKDPDHLADLLGAPFINALGDICPSESLTEESWRKIAADSWTRLKTDAEKQFGFLLEEGEETVEMITSCALAATQRQAGTAGLLGFFRDLYKSLATLKLEGSYPKGSAVRLIQEEQILYALVGQEKTNLMAHLPISYQGAVDKVKAELDAIVGLKKVKEYILSLEEYYKTQKRRQEAGLKASEVSKHMIFTGNPGTGKTTIARIVSRYLKAIGVLSGGQLVEVSRADLVGRYVGHTAPLVNQVIKSAIGGVLFIDEAYSLHRGKEDSFGLEAIDALVKGIEDNRDDLIVILAGYAREMEEFLETNSGLKSRFPNLIDFPDYSGEELLDITRITVKSKGYVLDQEAEAMLLIYYNEVQAHHADTAGNGRLVRNKVEEAILNQSRRLVAEPEADLSLLKVCDFIL